MPLSAWQELLPCPCRSSSEHSSRVRRVCHSPPEPDAEQQRRSRGIHLFQCPPGCLSGSTRRSFRVLWIQRDEEKNPGTRFGQFEGLSRLARYCCNSLSLACRTCRSQTVGFAQKLWYRP